MGPHTVGGGEGVDKPENSLRSLRRNLQHSLWTGIPTACVSGLVIVLISLIFKKNQILSTFYAFLMSHLFDKP